MAENDAEAVDWYQLAADRGYAAAQSNLGLMYANGWGVPEDYVRAYAWWILAAAQEIESAIQNMNDLETRMTADDIARAEELSATLLDRIE